MLGQLFEVDTDGNGAVVNNVDANNFTLGQLLTAGTLCSQYVLAKWNLQREMSPWAFCAGSLWVAGAPQAGHISCSVSSGVATASIIIQARDCGNQIIHVKEFYSD